MRTGYSRLLKVSWEYIKGLHLPPRTHVFVTYRKFWKPAMMLSFKRRGLSLVEIGLAADPGRCRDLGHLRTGWQSTPLIVQALSHGGRAPHQPLGWTAHAGHSSRQTAADLPSAARSPSNCNSSCPVIRAYGSLSTMEPTCLLT